MNEWRWSLELLSRIERPRETVTRDSGFCRLGPSKTLRIVKSWENRSVGFTTLPPDQCLHQASAQGSLSFQTSLLSFISFFLAKPCAPPQRLPPHPHTHPPTPRLVCLPVKSLFIDYILGPPMKPSPFSPVMSRSPTHPLGNTLYDPKGRCPCFTWPVISSWRAVTFNYLLTLDNTICEHLCSACPLYTLHQNWEGHRQRVGFGWELHVLFLKLGSEFCLMVIGNK